MKLLIDADYIVYKSCQVCETEIDFGDDVIVVTSRFSDAYKQTLKEINKIESNFFSSSSTILFFSDSVNFRKSIFPDYKGHRNRKKPCGYRRVIEQLKKLNTKLSGCLHLRQMMPWGSMQLFMQTM